MAKFEETYDKWLEVNKQLYNDCVDYLTEILETIPEKSIGLGLYDDTVCVAYDGGNHPEYASNCFSVVNSVYLKDGKIYIDTEDCNGYPIECITADELHNITSMAQLIFINEYDLED